MDLENIFVNGVSLSVLIIGLVELVKQFGVSGKWLTISSFAIGLVLGVLYQISLGVPADFGGWFGAIAFGLAAGLVACKVYDAVRNAANPNNGLG